MITRLYEEKDIDIIKDKLLNGEIIAFPTDTVFGLACIYDNEDAKNRIMQAKGRDEGKPLPMMTTKELIGNVAYINNNERKLIEKFMPGAITIVFKKKDLPDFVTNGKDTVAIRVPDDEWILSLINKVNKPLLVTSANLSDTPSLTDWVKVNNELNSRINGVVMKDARGGVASTIVIAIDEVKILREGPISKEEIDRCLNG